MFVTAWAAYHLLVDLLFLWVATRALLIARDNRRRLNALQVHAPDAVPPPREEAAQPAGDMVVRAAAAWGSEVLGAIAVGTPAERAVVQAAPRVVMAAGSLANGRIGESATPVPEPPPVVRQPEQARLPPPHVPYSTGAVRVPIAQRPTWGGTHQRMMHSPLRQRFA